MKRALIILFMLINLTCRSQNKYSEKEISYIKLFKNFTGYIKKCIDGNINITDTIRLKHILLNYLFIDSPLDSTDLDQIKTAELPKEKLNILISQIRSFSHFLQEYKDLAENLSAIPVRFSNDRSLYNSLSSFQKENTFIFFDKRFPQKIIGYLLFIPRLEKIISTPRLWSWTLTYQFGKYMFRSITGEDGYEYIFTPK